MTRAHDAALVALLRTDPQLTSCVYLDEVIPGTVKKYLRVRVNTGTITADRAAGPARIRRKTYWLTGVGTTPGQAAWLLEQAVDNLANHVLDVPGWVCARLELAASQPVDLDPDVDGRYVGIDQWDLTTEPIG